MPARQQRRTSDGLRADPHRRSRRGHHVQPRIAVGDRVSPRRGHHPAARTDLRHTLVLHDFRRRHRRHIHHLPSPRQVSAASASDDSHRRQRSSPITTVPSGSPTSDREDEDAPGRFPGLRPAQPRDARFFASLFSHGASEDGRRDEAEDSFPRRRSSSAIRSPSSAITRSCSTNPASSSAHARALAHATHRTTPEPRPKIISAPRHTSPARTPDRRIATPDAV